MVPGCVSHGHLDRRYENEWRILLSNARESLFGDFFYHILHSLSVAFHPISS